MCALLILQVEEAGETLEREHYESLFITCVRAHDTRRADLVLQQLQEMPGELSQRVYRELAVAAIRGKNPGRVTRAWHCCVWF